MKDDIIILIAGSAAAIVGMTVGLWLGLQPIRDLTNDMDALASEIDALVREIERPNP